MEILFKEGQTDFKDVHIKNDNKIFSMYFMNVGDLFWTINKSEPYSIKETFDIPVKEKEIYKLFDDLYKTVSKARIIDARDDKYLKNKLVERELFNKETKTIKWHSDATYFDSDDVVKIIKEKDNYHLEFTRPEKYEDPFHMGSGRMISIRFRNSGSYYDPFNIAFMEMFRNAQKLKERTFEEESKEER